VSRLVDRFTAMGCEIAVAGARRAELRSVERLFRERELRFSRFLPESELNRVNRAAGRFVIVSRDFAAMVNIALWAARETNGLIDPTLGGALLSAGYDRDIGTGLDTGRSAGEGAPGCWRALSLCGNVLRAPAGVVLDLNGVVKSQTADQALAMLEGPGWVSAGGDIATRGGVGVALPGGGAVHVRAGGIATSGRTRRSWRAGGVTSHHLIDGSTGRPSRSCWREVTVSGATCLHADIAAKAAFLLGEDGPAWLDARGVPGRFVDARGRVVPNTTWASDAPERVTEHVACT
jgi:FAD:protein FMN transferase